MQMDISVESEYTLVSIYILIFSKAKLVIATKDLYS